MSEQTVEVEYVVGLLRKVGRAYGSSWSVHIGVVDHRYGAHLEQASVRTLCGRRGAMKGQGSSEPIGKVECGTCLRVWNKGEHRHLFSSYRGEKIGWQCECGVVRRER